MARVLGAASSRAASQGKNSRPAYRLCSSSRNGSKGSGQKTASRVYFCGDHSLNEVWRRSAVEYDDWKGSLSDTPRNCGEFLGRIEIRASSRGEKRLREEMAANRKGSFLLPPGWHCIPAYPILLPS